MKKIENKKICDILIEYDNVENVIKAAKCIAEKDFVEWDVYSPFPIHGIEKVMKLKKSFLPWIVFFFGITGGFTGIFLTIWTSAYELPLNIGGKPLLSIAAFFPVIFELVILFSAISCVFGMFFLCKLPLYNFKFFDFKDFNRVTDDRFFISLNFENIKYDETFINILIKETKALNVNIIEG